MGPVVPDTVQTYLILLAAGFLATEPWRWLGLLLARNLDVDSELFRWTRAVSTAIVAGLVAKILVFPQGALAGVPLGVRLVAFTVGVGVFVASGRRILPGVGAGIGLLLLARWALG